MKAKRDSDILTDFSAGLLTKAPLVGTDLRFTPYCMNVHDEGTMLSRRSGISKVSNFI